jgi:hypothetical protein
VVEPEENQGKQLSMIPSTHSTWFNLVISLGCMFISIYRIVDPTFLHLSSLFYISMSPPLVVNNKLIDYMLSHAYSWSIECKKSLE